MMRSIFALPMFFVGNKRVLFLRIFSYRVFFLRFFDIIQRMLYGKTEFRMFGRGRVLSALDVMFVFAMLWQNVIY